MEEEVKAEEQKQKTNGIPTKELVNKIFTFCEYLGNVKLFPYQSQFAKRLIRSLLENDGEEITCLMSRQSGKSHTVGVIVSGCAVILPILANMPMFLEDPRLKIYRERGMLIGIFAPALHQSQIIFTKIKDNLSTEHAKSILLDPEINIRFGTNNGQNVVLQYQNFDLTSTITCMSASDQSNIEGKTYMLIIVDEAQDVSDFKYLKSIIPMAAFYNGTRVLIGTPTITRGFFHNAIETNNREYLSGERQRNHFEYDWKTVIRYNPNYEKHIEMQKRKIGEDSDEFKMSYALKWIFERGMFIDAVKFEEMCGNTNLDRVRYDRNNICVAGIDLGKRNDSTVVTVVQPDWENPIVVEKSGDGDISDFVVYDVFIKDWLEIQGDNWNEQYDIILNYLYNFRLERVLIDATGVGNPIFDRLAPALSSMKIDAVPFVFTTQSKSELFKHFDSQIKAGRFQYPASPETQETQEYQRFMEQMISLEKTYNGQHMVCSAPKERKAHDDYPVSAALAVMAAKGEAANRPVTEKINPFIEKAGVSYYYQQRNRLTARRSR